VLVVVGCASLVVNATPAAAANPGSKLWKATYTTLNRQDDIATATIASPDGSTVFVTGSARGKDFETLAYDPITGTMRWGSAYSSASGLSIDQATSIAVSPDGHSVYVAGRAASGAYGTVAYDAASGAQRWAALYYGPGVWTGNSSVGAKAIAVSPDGSRVFVTGVTTGTSTLDYATVAYGAADGQQQWARTYNGPAGLDDRAVALGVSPDGSKAVVTGVSVSRMRGPEFITLAYRSTDGVTSWFSRYSSATGKNAAPAALSISPDGVQAVVSGSSYETADGWRSTSVAYDLVTGAQRWAVRRSGPGIVQDYLADVAVSPDSTTVFATGRSQVATGWDYLTVAYDAATGAQRWEASYDGTGHGVDTSKAITVSDDGSSVVVTGESSGGQWLWTDFATIAYDGASGAQRWATRHNLAFGSVDGGNDVIVVPGSGVVVATGWTSSTTGVDYATVAMAL
jgi:hypothetical protein